MDPMSLIEKRSQGIRLESSIVTHQQDQKIWFDAATQSFSDIISRLERTQPTADQTCPLRLHPPQASHLKQPDQNSGPGDHVPSQVTQGMWATIQHLHGPSNTCGLHCPCKCHIGKKCGQFRIAPFDSIFGSISMIFFGWKMMGPRCNVLSCHKLRFKLFQVTFSIPLNAWNISVVASFSLFDGKPTIGVNLGPTPNVTNEHDKLGIFSIVRGKNLPELKLMLQRRPGAVLDVSHRQGFSALHYAFQSASVETIKVLLAAGADPFYEDHGGAPAIYEGFLRMLQSSQDERELKDSLPISAFFDDYNFSHIHRIVLEARPLGLQAELGSSTHIADIDSQDDMKSTPLHWAALKRDPEAVATLLAAGAIVDTRDSKGKTALTKACIVGSEACVEKLLAFGADVNAGDKYDYRPIHFAVQSNATGTLLSMLLSNGADVNDKRNMFSRTPLVRAASFNSARSCKYLLENMADVNHTDGEGDPPLFESVTRNAHECLELLLAWNAQYLQVRSGGQTLLHLVAIRGDKCTLDILAAAKLKGLDVNAKDANSMTARQLFATRSGVPDDTMAAFENLLARLAEMTVGSGDAGDEIDSDEGEPQFFDALEVLG